MLAGPNPLTYPFDVGQSFSICLLVFLAKKVICPAVPLSLRVLVNFNINKNKLIRMSNIVGQVYNMSIIYIIYILRNYYNRVNGLIKLNLAVPIDLGQILGKLGQKEKAQ